MALLNTLLLETWCIVQERLHQEFDEKALREYYVNSGSAV